MSNEKKKFLFELELSDEDYINVCKLSGGHGISVNELLENFVRDLVGSSASNGSDERHAAREWFDRCWFGMFPEDTFLKHLIECGDIKDFVEHYQSLKECQSELLEGPDDEETVEGLKEEMAFQKQILKEYYDDYVADYSYSKHESYDEGTDLVIKWWNEMTSRMLLL